MGLMLKLQRNGKLRKCWYGVYTEADGARKVVNLNLKWKGVPPASGRVGDSGDQNFEASREKATTLLERYAEDARRKGRADHLVERLIETKTGQAVQHARIDELAARWLGMPRTRMPSDPYVAGVKAACERFRAFMAERKPPAVYLYEVDSSDAGAFAERLRASLAPRTAGGYCNMLRSAFSRFLPAGRANPFAGIISRQTLQNGGGSVHRVPFTAKELSAVMAAAQEHEGGMLYGPVVAAACTALRRGDACGLDWRSVDLAGGAVTVKTSKTGETVDLPLLKPLRAVLEASEGPRTGPCFPEAARMLRANPDGLTWRFKAIVARALADEVKTTDRAEIEAAGRAAIEGLPEGSRRERMADAFRRYMAGESVPGIAHAMGVSKGSVSGWLSTVAGMTGMPVIRGGGTSIRAGVARHTQAAREHGQRAASLRDWHALRTTFVTLALSAGVPIELVRKVTGHRTVEIVLANYFRPGRETLRAALTEAMPAVLTGEADLETGEAKLEGEGQKAQSELVVLAERVAAGTATEKDRKRLRTLAGRV